MSPLPPEVERMIEESFAADRARDQKRRMKTGALEIELEGALDDWPVSSSEFQGELSIFSKTIRQSGILHSQRAIAFDAVDASGYPLAEFTIRTLGPPAIGIITAAVSSWLAGRAGRKARLKFGDIEAEARTPEEVERLLKAAAAFRASIKEAGEEE